MKRLCLASFLFAACASTSATTTNPSATPATATARKPLYERLGGKDAIGKMVDTFLARVAADSQVNARFAHSDVPHLRDMLVDQICEASGGPCKYMGRDMKTAHEGMKITDGEFDALVADVQAVMQQFNVPGAEQKEVLGMFGGMRSDIVGQ